MQPVTAASALAFIDAVQLPPNPLAGFERAAAHPDKAAQPDATKNQATVVGSEVVSFLKGVTNEQRQDVVNTTLLAQLVANRKVPDHANIFAWFEAYFEVLGQLGWVIENKGFSSYEEQADGLEAHEAILQIAAVVLGATPTALAIVTSTIQSMKAMDQSRPWITIFDRESKRANTARFQVAVAQTSKSSVLALSLMAFALEAETTLTQVLFFKFRRGRAKLKQCSTSVVINQEVLVAVRDKVKKKLGSYVNDYVDSLNLG